ncbi:MAG: YciI family protein [Bryobacterales bacterium]|nr:YciI family protein [Bryobacterales bacterium]
MRYMFLIYSQETLEGPPPEELDGLIHAHRNVMDEARARNVLIAVDSLKPTITSTTVRKIDGKLTTFDGPFAETKEQLAGYYVIDCRDLDEAIEWARKIPAGCRGGSGCIEIRPVGDLPVRGE